MKGWHLVLMGSTFIIGVFMHDGGVFSPIHEEFHVTAAHWDGVETTARTWNKTTLTRLTESAVLSGYWWELTLTAVAVVSFGRWGTLFAGWMVGVMGRAPTSLDFNSHLLSWTQSAGMSEQAGLSHVAQNLSQFQIVAWWSVAILVIRYAFLLRRLPWKSWMEPVEDPDALVTLSDPL